MIWDQGGAQIQTRRWRRRSDSSMRTTSPALRMRREKDEPQAFAPEAEVPCRSKPPAQTGATRKAEQAPPREIPEPPSAASEIRRPSESELTPHRRLGKARPTILYQ